ncbi:MAG: threonine-phosphate decarboxylase CobD [Deltaproteobacteria bacterium]|nr:threonine-phosphate decarboxylase CobD [Deltaproteobacteria bacterium]
MTAHIHGGRVFEAARELSLPWEDILDFSANINPLGQPPGLKERLFSQFAATVHYPDMSAEGFTQAAAEKSGLPLDCVFPGAGSTPHIRMLARFFSPKKPLILAPAFAEYAESLVARGLRPDYVYAREKDGFLPVLAILDEIRKREPDLIFLANPANPTGRLVPEETLQGLLSYGTEKRIPVIVDEAFIDFTFRKSMEGLVTKHPHLVVLRSLTKVFAVPGLRLAYLAASPGLVSEFKSRMEPWPINFMALEAGIYSLGKEDFIKETPLKTREYRDALADVLKTIGDLTPSDANFVLVRTEPSRGRRIRRALYQKGILVRDASNFQGLGEGYLRFAVRPPKETEVLKKALREIDA